MSKYLIGTDPELFLTLDGQPISAEGLIPGTKHEPFKVEKGALQVDGLAAEFNIDPASTEDEFNNNIKIVLIQLREYLDRHDSRIQMNFVPFMKFDPKYFKKLSDISKILGCDPDFNYNGQIITATEKLANMPIRTAAGHIHIGWTKDVDPMDPAHFEDCKFISQYFYNNSAAFNRLISSISYYGTKEENERLKYYGMMGAFRPKHYGIELRQYSNLWVESEQNRKKVFRFIIGHMAKIDKQ